MTGLKRIAVPFAVLVAAGCASSEVPANQMADSQAAIRAATEVGAEQEPQAALHLKQARDRMARAQALSRKGDNEAAARLLEQAEVDAELALVIARKQQAATEAQEARERLEALESY